MNIADLKIIIENPKGSYKSFETEGDRVWNSYPLKGVTYPVDYGYIRGYIGEDGADLDIFVGTGELCGYIKIWRLDVPEETKFFTGVTQAEFQAITETFTLVLVEYKILDKASFNKKIKMFKKKKGIFTDLFKNIAALYRGRNLLWQLIFIALTFVCARTGFDWFYYQSTQAQVLQGILFPAALFGFIVPVFAPLAMLLSGLFTRNKRTLNAFYAVVQAGLLGLGISSLYKVFTGRVGLPHGPSLVDTSEIFRFGFLRGGAFQGWPSSHTSVAFAMSMALVTLYPESKIIKYTSIAYALYIGLGVSATIHWFSDFLAGAILGTLIGIAVGKSFLERYAELK